MAGVTAADPYTALAGAALGTIGSIAKPAPAGPSNAGGGSQGGGLFDSSGWNVTFGQGASITSDYDKTQTQGTGKPGTAAQAAGMAVQDMGNLLPYAVGALLLVAVAKKLKKK